MATVLARSGVRYLVVSNDLDPTRTGAPRPVLVHQALADSPGLTLAASFGPPVGDPGTSRSFVTDSGLDPTYPAVEIYEVAALRGPVTAMPTAASWVVSGGPESLFQLADRGLLGGRATLLAGDGTPGPGARSALTDALRRREVDFGNVRDNASTTLTATQPLTRAQPVPDVLPVPGGQHLATAQFIGATSVSASSSASDAGAVLDRGRDHPPFAAFDGDPSTAWVSGALSGARGQWVQLDLATAVDPSGTTIQLLRDDRVRGTVTAVRVRTDRGERVTQLYPDTAVQAVAVPPGETRHLRVTVDSVRGDGFGTLVGLREVRVPHVNVQQTIALPDDQPTSRDPVVLLDRAVGARDGCAMVGLRAVCSPALPRAGEDVVRLDRTFLLQAASTFAVTGTARPVAGPALDALLDAGSPVRVTASSRLVPDPAERPGAVVDGDAATGWIAAQSDGIPSLTLSWSAPHTVDHLVLTTDSALAAARPTRVDIVTPRGTTPVVVPADGVVRFPRTTTDHVELRFVGVEQRWSVGPGGSVTPLPVGISEVSGLGTVTTRSRSPISLPCGSAPPIAIDGIPHPTSVLGDRYDVLRLRPVLLLMCDTRPITLEAGSHRVAAAGYDGLQVEGLTLGSAGTSATPAARTTQVRRWDAEHREVDVAPGAESYLVVHENANSGWRAVLDGKVLSPARIDGWQQAWVVPAGSGGRVSLDFRPARAYHLALAGGGLLVLLLLALALWPDRRVVTPQVATERRLAAPLRYAGSLLVMVLVGGTAGAAAYLVLLLTARRAPRAADGLPLLAGAAVVLAGALTAWAPWNGSRAPAAFGTPAQVLAVIALAAAAAALSGSQPSGASDPARAAPPAEG
jgi:arabinofuranan 3-O-arabinosyltransferase